MPLPTNLPTFDITITDDNINKSVQTILLQLRPKWPTLEFLNSREFSDGLTNKLISYFLSDNPRDAVIFKIYGQNTESIIDRDAEIRTMTLLKKLGLGSELYGVFSNGIIYEYIPGTTLDVENIRKPEVYTLVAKGMADLHSIPLSEAKAFGNQETDQFESIIWHQIFKFHQLAEQTLKEDQSLQSEFKSIGISIAWATAAIQELRKLIEMENMPLVFAHNDLLLGNIIYDEKDAKVSFIDFEYGGPNYAPFDVANHFNEFVGTDECDYEKYYPSKEFRSKWIEIYLKELPNNNWDKQTFERWVTLCTPLSHVLWLLWCVVQAGHSKLDFDYVNYARLRFPAYQEGMTHVRRIFI